MITAQELYSQAVRTLPVSEQLRLATIILEGITTSDALNYCDQWSEEDIRDMTAFSFRHASRCE